MPVRSSLCTYSPSTAGASSSSTSKYSSILPTSSSLSYGQYKPLSSSNSGSFRSSSSTASISSQSTAGTSTLGRYNRLASSHSPSYLSSSSSSSSSTSSSSYSPSAYSSASNSSSVGLYKPLSSSTHNSFSNRYSGGSNHHLSASSAATRYSPSTSSTGSLSSSSSSTSGDASYHYKSPVGSSLSSSAYSSGSSLSSASSSSSSNYTSPYTSRASRRLSSSSAASPSSPLPPGVPCGLVNLGNTCYMNASLQSLYALESFRNLILSRYNTDHDKVLTHELCEVFKLLKASNDSTSSSSSQNSVSPANFKYAFSRYQTKFSGFGQQDAQEFLRYLVNGIHEESNAASKRPRRTRPVQAPKTAQEAWSQYRDIVDDSPLVDLLVGQLCSTITCGECQNKSHCWDPFWDLSLPLMTRASGGSTYSWRSTSSQLSDVIEEFTSKEVLDSDERPICSHCKKATKSTKQISLARLPRLMILHLKKFTNDGYKLTSGEIHINKQLTFNGTSYNLKACISHHGHSSSSGHYTAHCEYSSKWFHFDDGRVRDVTQTFDSNKLDDAYVLFYTQSRAGGSGSSSLSQSKL